MLFNSFHFLLFFPAVVLIYFVLPQRIKWVWLLVSSYYFYMAWNPRYALLIAVSTILTFVSGLLLEYSNGLADETKKRRQKKLWVALSFASNLAILFFFKYFYFALDNINNVLSHLGLRVLEPAFDVLLPVGISFYTFQALSYTVDVYRGEIRAEKNIGKYALFVSFFPQLVAGPIERAKNLLIQVHEKHYFEYDRVRDGLLLMVWGFFQKIAIADRVAVLVNPVYNNYEQCSGIQLVLATLFFAVQIYCDFAGYSNIAIGAAQVMGFRLMNNFRRPYFATSMQDFWRRWHISLSTWFRDYLYIPLGGNRVGIVRKYINIMLTFLVSGLWHGANWNFVIWGGLHGAFLVIGEATQPWRDKLNGRLRVNVSTFSHRLFKILITFGLVTFAWIFFRAQSAGDALAIIDRIYSSFNLYSIANPGFWQAVGLGAFDLVLIVGGLAVLFGVSLLQTKIQIREWLKIQALWFRWLMYLLALFCVVFVAVYYSDVTSQQFIYFQF